MSRSFTRRSSAKWEAARSHELLHTGYKNRKRIVDEQVPLGGHADSASVDVNICVGTSCFLKGSQKLLHEILDYLRVNRLEDQVNVSASFCFEKCDRGPTVRVGEEIIEHCTLGQAIQAVERQTGASLKRGRAT